MRSFSLKSFGFALSLTCAAGVCAVPAYASTADETAALAALGKGDVDGAIRLFSAALSTNDPAVDRHYDLVARGIAYSRKNQDDLALKDYDEALKLQPNDGDAHLRRGNILVQEKQYPGAVEDLTAAITATPDNATAYYLRGFSYNALNDDTKAAADHDKACELNKDYCN